MVPSIVWRLRCSLPSYLSPPPHPLVHLRESLAVTELALPDEAMTDLDGMAAAGAGLLAGRPHGRGERRMASVMATVSTLTRATRRSRSITRSLWSAKR